MMKGMKNITYGMCRKLSVADSDLHEYALILVGWIWIRIGKAEPDAGG
jgi:hypothetical protein